jgi:hypothetical protein
MVCENCGLAAAAGELPGLAIAVMVQMRSNAGGTATAPVCPVPCEYCERSDAGTTF